MKKSYIFLIIGIILLACGLGFYFYKRNTPNNYNGSSLNDFPYNSTRVSATENSSNENDSFIQNENSSNNQSVETNTSSTNETATSQAENNNTSKEDISSETEIASFTTKIYTKDSARQNNISITCSKLNDTTIENGNTFSFCNVVGKATSSKGYQKADVFQDGEKIEALGRSETVKLVPHFTMLF